MNLSVPQSPPSVIASGPPVGVPALSAPLQAALSRFAKLAPWGFLALPALGILAIFLAIAIEEGVCDASFDESCGQFNLYLTFGLEFLFAFLLLACLASVMGARAGRRAASQARARYAPLLQSAKDWFVRGDVTEEEFERIRAQVDVLLAPAGPEASARAAAGTLRWAAAIFTFASLILVMITMALVVEAIEAYYYDPYGWPLANSFMAGTALFLAAATTGWVLAARGERAARAIGESLAAQVNAQEEAILRAGHARRSGGAARSASAPSFRSFGGR